MVLKFHETNIGGRVWGWVTLPRARGWGWGWVRASHGGRCRLGGLPGLRARKLIESWKTKEQKTRCKSFVIAHPYCIVSVNLHFATCYAVLLALCLVTSCSLARSV